MYLCTLAIAAVLIILARVIGGRFRYYVLQIYTFFTIIIGAIYTIIIALAKPFHPSNMMIPSYYIKYVIFAALGIKVELRNINAFPKNRNFIVVANHQSDWDFMLMVIISRFTGGTACVGKKSLFYLWPFGLAYWLCGAVFIDRKNAANTKLLMDKEKKVLMSDPTHNLWISPEGTRNPSAFRTRKLLPFRFGAFKIAIDCKIPIVPVVHGPWYFRDDSTKFLGSGTTISEILPAIETKDLTVDDVETLAQSVYEMMQSKYDELCQEISRRLPKDHPYLQNER